MKASEISSMLSSARSHATTRMAAVKSQGTDPLSRPSVLSGDPSPNVASCDESVLATDAPTSLVVRQGQREASSSHLIEDTSIIPSTTVGTDAMLGHQDFATFGQDDKTASMKSAARSSLMTKHGDIKLTLLNRDRTTSMGPSLADEPVMDLKGHNTVARDFAAPRQTPGRTVRTASSRQGTPDACFPQILASVRASASKKSSQKTSLKTQTTRSVPGPNTQWRIVPQRKVTPHSIDSVWLQLIVRWYFSTAITSEELFREIKACKRLPAETLPTVHDVFHMCVTRDIESSPMRLGNISGLIPDEVTRELGLSLTLRWTKVPDCDQGIRTREGLRLVEPDYVEGSVMYQMKVESNLGALPEILKAYRPMHNLGKAFAEWTDEEKFAWAWLSQLQPGHAT